jgi:PilZ domain
MADIPTPAAAELLRQLPGEVWAIGRRGGGIRLKILDVAADGGAVRVLAPVSRLAEGDHVQIRVRRPGEPRHDIDLEVESVFFESTTEVVATLAPRSVAVRAVPRLRGGEPPHALVTGHAAGSARAFEGPLEAISETGLGFHAPWPLHVGERLRLRVPLPGGEVDAEAIVIASERAAFGRTHVRCEFVWMSDAGRIRIAALARGGGPAGPSALAA